MDPVAALRLFLEACGTHDREAAKEHLSNLKNWIDGDGFLPQVHWDTAVPPKPERYYLI